MAAGTAVSRTGETLADRYRLDTFVREDAVSEVYRAVDTREQSAVVVRVLRPELALRAGAVESFVTLPRALVKVPAPHMARVIEVATDDVGIPFIVEELVDGQPLADLLAEHPRGVDLPTASRILLPLIEALARLHMAGVVHGHLDLQRVALVLHGGEWLSRLVHYDLKPPEDGFFNPFCPPEQTEDKVADEPTADVWALGAIAMAVLTGSPSPPEPSQTTTWPDGLARAVQECFEPNLRRRMPDAATLLMQIEPILAPLMRAPAAPRPSTSEPAAAVEPSPKPAAAKPAAQPSEPAHQPVVAQPLPVVPTAVAAPPAARQAPASASTPVAPQAQRREAQRPAVGAELDLVAAQVNAAVGSEADLSGGASAVGIAAAAVERAPIQATHVVSRGRPVAAPAQPQAPAPAKSEGFETPAQLHSRTPGALSAEQMRVLLEIDQEKEHAAWPWVRYALALLLLFLLYRAVPMLMEPDFAAARKVFGPQLKIAAAAFAGAAVVAAIRTWIVVSKKSALLGRPVIVVSQVVALCICASIGSAWFLGGFEPFSAMGDAVGGGHGVRAGGAIARTFGAIARRVLPYGATLLFLFGGVYALLSAIRSMGQSRAAAVAALVMALAAGAAGVQMTLTTIQPQLRAELEARARGDEATAEGDIGEIKRALGPKKIDINNLGGLGDQAQSDAPVTRQRTSIGDGNDTDVMLEDMKAQRSHQSEVIKRAERELPVNASP